MGRLCRDLTRITGMEPAKNLSYLQLGCLPQDVVNGWIHAPDHITSRLAARAKWFLTTGQLHVTMDRNGSSHAQGGEMPTYNGRTVASYLVPTLAALPVGDAVPPESILDGQADGYQFRIEADGGTLTLAGGSDLAIYERKTDTWIISDPSIGLAAQVIADGGLSTFSFDNAIDCRLVAIVMPGMTGPSTVTVTERNKR